MEYKSTPQFTTAVDDRTVRGVFAVHGNVDADNDVSHPGSFADTKLGGRDRVRFLWMHNAQEPPVAVIRGMRELGRAELPQKVLSYAPDATGGVEIVREYLDTPRGNEILTGIKAGAIEEMSYGYLLGEKAFDFSDIPGKGRVRNLRKVTLLDVSDVNWGLNPATVGMKGYLPIGLSLADHAEALRANAEAFLERIHEIREMRAKDGRVLSGANRERLRSHQTALAAVLSDIDALLAASEPAPKATDPEKVEPPPAPPESLDASDAKRLTVDPVIVERLLRDAQRLGVFNHG